MGTSHPLIARFARARLPLELARGPLGRGAGLARVVQLDISRTRGPERFVLWPGDAHNRLEVEGTDRDLRQLVLLVDEPERSFEVEVGRFASVDPTRVVRREGHRRWVRERTVGLKRHFLLGMDEAHLFIAQLPKGTSAVHQAHRLLKGDEVRRAEAAARTEALRQGEWFFVREPSDRQALLDALALTPSAKARLHVASGIAQAARQARPGRPHVADEVLVVADRVSDALWPLRNGVFVRGSVRHPDHATVIFREWYRAVGNSEARSRVEGLTWVD